MKQQRRIRYGVPLVLVLILFCSYSVGNEFIKKTPTRMRKEKAQKESLSDQCARLSDEVLLLALEMPSSLTHFCKTVYQLLRSVACGESCIVDTADINKLKEVIACLEQCKKSMTQLEDALAKVKLSLAT